MWTTLLTWTTGKQKALVFQWSMAPVLKLFNDASSVNTAMLKSLVKWRILSLWETGYCTDSTASFVLRYHDAKTAL